MSPRKTPNGHYQQLFHCEETDHPTDFCAVSAPKKPTISIDAIAIALMATKMDGTKRGKHPAHHHRHQHIEQLATAFAKPTQRKRTLVAKQFRAYTATTEAISTYRHIMSRKPTIIALTR